MSDPEPPSIQRPRAPQPPAPPAPPLPPVSSPPSASALAKLLKEGKQAEVLESVRRLSDAQLTMLEDGLVLANDRNRNQRYALRRIIRFVRAEQKGLTAPQSTIAFSVSGGSTAVETPLPGGTKAAIRTGVRVTYGSGGRDDGFTITYTGSTTRMHWLMFAWRQVIAVYPPALRESRPRKVPLQARQLHTGNGRTYLLTVDPKRPRWTTDGGSKHSAFYEKDTSLSRNPSELLLADPPSPQVDGLKDLFGSSAPPDKAISRFHAAAYLVRDMDVLYRADVDLEWDLTRNSSAADGYSFGAQRASKAGRAVSGLAAEHRACLASQLPEFDYFPGPVIPPPQPADPFDPIGERARADTDMASWHLKVPLDRPKTVARVAQASLIEDIGPLANIHQASATTKATGLNYLAALQRFPEESGEVIFLDKDGNPRDSQMPVERKGPLPTLAITLTPSAFEFGNPKQLREPEVSLGVMRHEMMHAAHFRLAIGWLLKWRDDLSELEFHPWLREAKRRNEISEVDFNIIVVTRPPAPGPFDRTTTEILSWTEDFVTGLQFNIAQPTLEIVAPEEGWPAAIIALKGMSRFFSSSPTVSGSTKVQDAVKDRIREVACGLMTKDQRNVLVDWLDTLLKPEKLLPSSPTPSQKTEVKNLDRAFSDKRLLREIRSVVTSCRP